MDGFLQLQRHFFVFRHPWGAFRPWLFFIAAVIISSFSLNRRNLVPCYMLMLIMKALGLFVGRAVLDVFLY
jgi:hypothetical protein